MFSCCKVNFFISVHGLKSDYLAAILKDELYKKVENDFFGGYNGYILLLVL